MKRSLARVSVAVACVLALARPAMAEDATDAPPTSGAAAEPRLAAGARMMLPSGVDDRGEIGVGSWIELLLWAHYQVTSALAIAADVPLLLAQPLDGERAPDFVQAAEVTGRYRIYGGVHLSAALGVGVQQRMLMNPWGGVGAPARPGGLTAGFGIGVGVRHRVDRVTMEADAQVRAQLDSGFAGVLPDARPAGVGAVVHVPLAVRYAINDDVYIGAWSGLYTGDGVSLAANRGMSIPLVAGGQFAVNDHLAAGGFLGFSSLVPPDRGMPSPALGVSDTLTFGVFASYAQ